jgi:hypothetical protein
MRGTPTSTMTLFMDARSCFSVETWNPSSTTRVDARAMGFAPIMDRSLTAPQIASFPRSPPGKNRGFTVVASVVITMFLSPRGIVAPSSISGRPIPLSRWL